MISRLLVAATVMALLAVAGCGNSGDGARAGIWAAGSSTVFPFATRVAENYARVSKGAAPRVESLGTGGGIQAFCQGVGPTTPDVANASRPMKASEFEMCRQNGVTEIVELKIGFDGIVIATARDGNGFNFRLQDLYQGLAKDVPGGDDFIANPATTWNMVNPALPNQRIQVYGPPPTSGTRDAFVELVMDHGCKEFDAIKELEKSDEKKAKKVCQTIREDGAYIEAGENDNLIVNKLVANPNALGIFGYSFMEENLDKVQGETINGVAPTFETIADGKYPVSRPLFIYVKKAHVGVIPGIKEFVAEFTSEKAVGDEGYLGKKGLIPLPTAKRKQVAADANSLKTLAP